MRKDGASSTIRIEKMKEVITVVELDQFKVTLNAYREPLQEVRDSL